MTSAERQRMYRQRRKDAGNCIYCGKRSRLPNILSCAYCKSKPWRADQYARSKYTEKRQLVMEHYGGYFCACCGSTIPKFLAIDHVNNDGADHRESLGGRRQTSRIANWLIRNNFPPGFQVLCHSCNFGKHLNGGVCPHKNIDTYACAWGV